MKVSVQQGIKVIQDCVRTLPNRPGVYRMLGEKGKILYVGKAKNLKHRVGSYRNVGALSIRLQRMVAYTRSMEIVETPTQTDALLLEADLIKSLKPYYNVVLRDDKTYPEILVRTHHPVAQIVKHRGAHEEKGLYFGPFSDVKALHKTLATVQRVFLLRTCSDTVLKNRTRPCLQYQIKRCSAPCVDGYISQQDYKMSVQHTIDFLKGNSARVMKTLRKNMQEASENLQYERAAKFRDTISALAKITTQQDTSVPANFQADILAVAKTGGKACVQIFSYRAGRSYGTKTFFPRIEKHTCEAEILSEFMPQFYVHYPPPANIFVNIGMEDIQMVQSALSSIAKEKVYIKRPKRGSIQKILHTVFVNAQAALERKNAQGESIENNLNLLQKILHIQKPIQRLEVYDNSHIQGKYAIGAMIVARRQGFDKKSYRKWNIKTEEGAMAQSQEKEAEHIGGDDFFMMRQVFTRRFQKSQQKSQKKSCGEKQNTCAMEENLLPDVIIIDGGKGHLTAVSHILETLRVQHIPILCIAKGKDRNAGKETFFTQGKTEISIPYNSSLRYYLQTIRDEAHRFAITAHRKKRDTLFLKNPLDDIDGIGGKRKKLLLHTFGSAKEVANSSIDALKRVDGISQSLAEKIYRHFHNTP